MILCANCTVEAKYQYSLAPSSSVYYCASHLPKFLKLRAAAGELEIVQETKASKKKSAPVVEEPVVEEVVEEEAPTEE